MNTKTKGLTFKEDGLFDRQERIEWWNQQKLSQAKVMVVGAGAIGNEVLKNLALLGVGYIFVVDFDEIERSNLSRTVLFRREDLGKKKAEVAAKRTTEIALAEDFQIDWFHGDVIWELGTGIYGEMDLVLGCLDNVETRFAVNRACRLAGTPWIDAGIRELDGKVSCYSPKEPVCYGCTSSTSLALEKKNRYSCEAFKHKMQKEGKVPTVQISAARVAALQVQEAIYFLHGDEQNAGYELFYQGKLNVFDRIKLPSNPACHIHQLHPVETIQMIDSTSENTISELLEKLQEEPYSLVEPCLNIKWEKWRFVLGVRTGDDFFSFERPHFRIYQEEIDNARQELDAHDIEELSSFSLTETPASILSMTLAEIGVPKGHHITVESKEDTALFQLDVNEILDINQLG